MFIFLSFYLSSHLSFWDSLFFLPKSLYFPICPDPFRSLTDQWTRPITGRKEGAVRYYEPALKMGDRPIGMRWFMSTNLPRITKNSFGGVWRSKFRFNGCFAPEMANGNGDLGDRSTIDRSQSTWSIGSIPWKTAAECVRRPSFGRIIYFNAKNAVMVLRSSLYVVGRNNLFTDKYFTMPSTKIWDSQGYNNYGDNGMYMIHECTVLYCSDEIIAYFLLPYHWSWSILVGPSEGFPHLCP